MNDTETVEIIKVCIRCNEEKQLNEFHKDSFKYDGMRPYCKHCTKKISTERYWKTKDDPILRKKRLEGMKRYNDRTQYIRNMKSYYGIDGTEYQRLLDLQNGVCAICLKLEKRILRGKIARLSVDHCHKTGKIRGLLCNACNHLIGRADKSIEILTRAVNYLNNNKSNEV